jgi:arylsulfatase
MKRARVDKGSTALLLFLATLLLSPPEVRAEDALAKPLTPVAENREPVIQHPEQTAQSAEKLAALEKKFRKKPNVLVFLMDDVGWGDPGCYGGGLACGAPTVNIDKLAKDGLRLTSCYAQPSCSPTRATIMTGRLPMRHGILRPPMYGEPGGLEGEITLAQLLSKAGYTTQAVGKWHMGENKNSQPQNVGFDDFYGFLGVSDIYTEWRDPYFYPEIVNSPERTKLVEKSNFNRFLVHGKRGSDIENLEEITIPVSSTLDEKWADYSVEFLRKQAKSDKPFFLYHCTRGCHFDNYPNAKFKGKSPAKHPYKDVLVEIDDILGRLVKTLEETGQLDNTLIFVTSDNGPEMETWPDAGYTPFRGAKGNTWEGGMRVPGVAYWRGMITPGRTSDGLFDLADIFTTCMTLAGNSSDVPKDRFIDGVDQTSFLLSNDGESNRKFEYYWLMKTLSAVRGGEFKFLRASETTSADDVVNMGGFSGIADTYAYGKLYNLYLDPKESHSYLIRKLVYNEVFQSALHRHAETFKKYPPKLSVMLE